MFVLGKIKIRADLYASWMNKGRFVKQAYYQTKTTVN